LGDAKAQHNLANAYFLALGGLERDVLLAEQWNDKALANDPDDI
jgi:TPR repeat protein